MSDLKTSIENGVARMTVNRPEVRNAVRAETMDEMLRFLLAVEHNPDVGAVVLDAAGDHFISGGDLNWFARNAAQPPDARSATFEGMVHRMNPLFMTFERIPQVVIASVRGYVAGSGLCFLAAADLAVASDNAKFMLAHIKIGAPPDAGATYFLPRQVGMKRAKEIVFLGDTFGAEEAKAIGLINRVVANDQLEAETAKLAARFGSGPRRALGEAKKLMNQSLDNTLAEQLWAEASASGRITRTEDFVEGPTAFHEKRPPIFRGR